MNPMLAEFLGALIRFAAINAFAWFVSKGILTAEQTGRFTEYLSSPEFILLVIGSAAPLLWSLYAKFKSRQKLMTALTLPAGSTENVVESHVAAGAAPSVTTPKTEAP